MKDGQTYPGGELDLFAEVRNWKAYWSGELAPFLGQRVLEVGAGIGSNTRLLCDERRRAWLCLEPDRDLGARLNGRIERGEIAGPCAVECGAVRDLDPEARFDTVIYIDVLEHIEDDRAEMARAAELLDVGGHLVVLAPAWSFLYSPFDAAIGHLRRYDRQSLLALTPRGVELVRFRYLDSVGMLASAANRMLLRRSAPAPSQLALWDRVMVPLSLRLDPMIRHLLGKSALAVWTKR